MRTTVTIDDDLARAIDRLMRERGQTFKATINELLRRGLRPQNDPYSYTLPTFDAQIRPGVDLVKALALSASMDDEETLRKLELGK